jgi:tetratricopeptide (TPR) repeat protein
MRNAALIVALVTPLLMLGASDSADAQQQDRPAQNDNGRSIPDAPQPQKKPASKPQSGATPSSKDGSSDSSSPPPQPPDKTTPQQPAAKNDNPFPESVSRDAAKAAGDGSASGDSSSAGKPESPAPASTAPGTTKHPAADDNPFPEAVSRDAAKAAGDSSDNNTENNPKTAPKNDLPPGVSSSQSAHAMDDEPGGAPKVTDPVLAKKDTSVGGYYLETGNYQGALLRYKEAMASDPANVDAIFGLAEAQRMLKQNAEAARNYQLYLDILPNGPKAKQALKSLKALGTSK